MSRPLPLRLAPLWLRTKFYYRFYRGKNRHPDLFHGAPLEFAPGIRMDLHPTDEGHGQIAFTGFYELELTRSHSGIAQRGGLLVDVGANYGYFSLLWAARKQRNRVIAFEASPRSKQIYPATDSTPPLRSAPWMSAVNPAQWNLIRARKIKPGGAALSLLQIRTPQSQFL